MEELNAYEVRRTCDPRAFGFATTANLPLTDEVVGQDRARKALRRALDLGRHSYVRGYAGTGRETLAVAVAREFAAGGEPARDLCYVCNFDDPRTPLPIFLLPGQGRCLAALMESFINALPQTLNTLINQRVTREGAALAEELERIIEEAGCTVDVDAMELGDFKIIPDPELPEEKRPAVTPEELNRRAGEILAAIREADEERQAVILEAIRNGFIAQTIVEQLMRLAAYFRLDENTLRPFFRGVAQFVSTKALFLIYFSEEEMHSPEEMILFELIMRQLSVNLIVDNSESTEAPVVIAHNPSWGDLLGKVTYRPSEEGRMATDHTQIRAGALHQANGGVLVVDFNSLANDSASVDEFLALLKALREKSLQPRSHERSILPMDTLEPGPVPLDIRVIVLAETWIVECLLGEATFRDLFPSPIQFEFEMPRTPAAEAAYAAFIRRRSEEIGILPFDAAAVALMVEEGSRLAEDREKLSLEFGAIDLLIQEASLLARQKGQTVVTAGDVRQALEDRRVYFGYAEEIIREGILDGVVEIDTDGEQIGQVVGLWVGQTSDGHTFGMPTKISARTWAGRGGVISIERDADLSGPLHDKGFGTLRAYLNGQYALDGPLTLGASIAFDQVHGSIEGDSASTAELIALLSSLAEMPIKQGVAVTGAVNQNGRVQAIGGATQKIEGFYDVCTARGLTGEQGVIIPATNARHLMLRTDIAAAVRRGKFHIWAVSAVDEAIELLMDSPSGDIHELVYEKLALFAESNRIEAEDGEE